MRRIVTLIRGNVAQLRQVESATSEEPQRPGKARHGKKPDPTLDQIAAQFSRFDVEKAGVGTIFGTVDVPIRSPVCVRFLVPIVLSYSTGQTRMDAGVPSET
jgi:hypothetical protein